MSDGLTPVDAESVRKELEAARTMLLDYPESLLEVLEVEGASRLPSDDWRTWYDQCLLYKASLREAMLKLDHLEGVCTDLIENYEHQDVRLREITSRYLDAKQQSEYRIFRLEKHLDWIQQKSEHARFCKLTDFGNAGLRLLISLAIAEEKPDAKDAGDPAKFAQTSEVAVASAFAGGFVEFRPDGSLRLTEEGRILAEPLRSI